MTLANVSIDNVTFQEYVKGLWPKPTDEEIESKMASIPLSFVIVRHPLNRLTSLYHEKVISWTLGLIHMKRILQIHTKLKNGRWQKPIIKNEEKIVPRY